MRLLVTAEKGSLFSSMSGTSSWPGKKHAFPENRPQTQEEKKYLLSAAVMETVSETASSIWKVPLKLPSIMEMNLLVQLKNLVQSTRD